MLNFSTPLRVLGSLVLLLLSWMLSACDAGAVPDERPTVVLVTFNGLRADMVEGLGGRRGLTPVFDAFMAEADWAGRAIAPSSSALLSAASLLTGLQPSQQGLLHEGAARIPDAVATLPEVLRRRGYHIEVFHSSIGIDEAHGFTTAVEGWWSLGIGEDAIARLREIECSGRAVWVEIYMPTAPYRLFVDFLDRLEGLGGEVTTHDLPRRIEGNELLAYLDPKTALPDDVRRRWFSLYALSVARADHLMGQLFASLRDSGCWEQSVIGVTSLRGEEFGEYGQVGGGGSLGRRLIEVPMAIKLPRGRGLEDAPEAESKETTVSTARLFATIVEAAGTKPPPAAAPSLFHRAPSGALSELYLLDGVNQLSWVDGDRQLIWNHRFASPTPRFYHWWVLLGSDARAETQLAPLLRSFEQSPLLGTREQAELRATVWLERGQGGGRDEVPLEDDRELAALAYQLEQSWLRLNGGEDLPLSERPLPAASPR